MTHPTIVQKVTSYSTLSTRLACRLYAVQGPLFSSNRKKGVLTMMLEEVLFLSQGLLYSKFRISVLIHVSGNSW